MAQNDQRLVAGLVTIKYSRWSGFKDPEHTNKLVRSLDLARRIVDAAHNLLYPIAVAANPGAEAVLQARYQVLRIHFRLPNLVGADDSAKGQWVNSVLEICNTLRAIQLGLSSPVAIADSYSTTVGRAMEAARLEAEEMIGLGGKQWPAPQKEAFIRNAMREAGPSADREAMSMRGMVPLKKAIGRAWAENGLLDLWANKDPSLQVMPEQYASIHLNFPDLLQNPAVSLVCVARTIIHEASHRFCDTRDFAYAGTAEYLAMTAGQALWNADSYAYAAVSLYKGILFPTHRSMAAAPAGVDMNS